MTLVNDQLWVCSYNSRPLLLYEPTAGDGWRLIGVAATDCLLDVTSLADGTVVYSTGEAILFLTGVAG